MDINKQRLKNRLNVKFQPLKFQPASMKKLAIVDKITKQLSKDVDRDRDKEKSVYQSSRNRSINHMRLPSLEKNSVLIKKIQDKTQQIINIRQMKQRIKSIKVLPTIKVESKEPINDTITYLMKNQILNIPKIVAMLQKSQSEEFLYMKVIGIYEFQVCNQQEKGSHYITVSKNGMIRDGELTPLDKLIYQYEIFNKLKKNSFFKYFLAIKFMNKWHKGSKMIKFVQNKFKIKKLLFLDNEKILGWKVQLKNLLFISDKGGHINSGWVNRVSKQIESNKSVVEAKLLNISVKLLQKFQLPISQSFELMNKVLVNLLNLNVNFQKKIRIQKQLQIIYKLGMMLQFYELQSIAFYLISHIELICNKFQEKNHLYLDNILIPIQKLDFKDANYSSLKEKILVSTVIKQEISFKMLINEHDQVMIQPSMKTILEKIKNDIKQFVSKVQNFDYKIIRVPKFDYVTKNVIKPHQIDHNSSSGYKQTNLKQYIYSINAYYQKMKTLQKNAEIINQTMKRRIQLMDPFYRIYQNYKQKLNSQIFLNFNYDQISEQIDQIEENILTCQNKLHDGQFFLLGYLNLLEVKQQIINFIKEYKQSILHIIPSKIRDNKQNFNKNVTKHLDILRIVVKNADDFIKISTQCEELDQKIITYTADLHQIEKLQELFLRIKKIESLSLIQEKGLLNELKMKTKNFKDTKQNSYLLYKKQLQTYKKDLINKVDAIVPSQIYYELNPDPIQIFNKCHHNNIKLNQLSQQLKHLNSLQGFYDIKVTLIPKLQTLIVKFQSLEQIWQIYKQHQVQLQTYFYTNIMKIQVMPLIKKYEIYMRKCQRYNKDPDYYKLAHHLLQKIPLLLNSLYLIQDLHNPILRPIDYDEITQLFQKQHKIGRQTKDLTLSIVYESKLYNLREQVLQINFKSHKQQQIIRMLKEYDQWWKSIRLQGEYLDEYPLIIIFNDNDQLRKQIQQYSTILLNIINHKYGTFARKQCNNNLRNINNLAGLLELAITHQDKFLNLFPILTSKYAEKQIPSQAKKFMSIIQKTMKNVKWLIKPTQNLNENTKALLNNHIKQFDSISKTLASFLQKKRVKFQRFYFLQDDQLLEVLVGIGAENTIFRMFQGIKGWLVDKEGVKYGVQGIGRQNLVLRGWSYKTQQPQIIFKSLQDSIRINLNSIVRNILSGYENQLKQLKNLYPNMPWMCIYTVELILFTKQIQINCFQNNVDLSLQGSLIQENISTSVANPLQNSNYITLQLFLLHFIEELKHQNVNSIFDFKWHSFLRYYYQKDSVVMKIMGSEHHWGGQYQGLWNLMINTSDIRRAHTSILSNIKYGNGVLLQGPSGTGKTESLKELSRCMAKYCVVFNCSSQVNIRTLQKLLSGLCYTGSWLCLDEINRLTAQIMSVVANQINSIKNAVVQSKQIFSFMGKDMKLRKGVGIFSTMNPIYLKRAKLTQSLKSYFRIISVNVPDYEKILEVMLYSLGISSSSIYAHKISMMFKNLSIQLSLRSQYDFGLRAMKFFIFNLSLVRKKMKNQEQSIIQALCKTFYSRLQADDKQSFSKIIHDMFGKKIEEKQVNYKVSMMKEAPQTGIIVLGPTSCKTSIINQYTQLFDPHDRVVEIFNPNSLQLKYFLGENILGRWEQGIVQKMARGSFENSNKNYVLILDGKLKSQTIQNFNTLLDDSKLLSLSNGTRLKVHNNFKIILQTPDLQMTSPATITRCNVIYVSQNDFTKHDLIKRLLPDFNNTQTTDKMLQALSRFSISEIQQIFKISKLLFLRKVELHDKLTQSESIGFEKSIFYTVQLLGKGDKIKNFLHKDNSVVSKKGIFNYYLNFGKYKQGQFLQFEQNAKQMRTLTQVYVPTLRNKFYQYVNSRAYQNCQYVLWKGERMNGKSSSIVFSFQQIFKNKPEQKNILKLTINSQSSSKPITSFIQEKMSTNENQKRLLVYIDDIHLGSEEIFQFFRFTSQYQKIFSHKSKEIVALSKHTFIADSNNSYSKQFKSRFSRHFAQINLPPCQDNLIKSIYSELIKTYIAKTKTSLDFKTSYQLQLQRVVNFYVQYLRVNNKNYKQSFEEGSLIKHQLEYLGYCNLLPIIENFTIVNDLFCKQTTHFVGFAFSELRSQQVQHRKSIKQIDFIKLAYTEVFKNKYPLEYDRNLKSLTGHPTEVVKYSGIVKSNINVITNWEEYKAYILNKLENHYYLSEFMLLEIMKILRILQWNGGNYYLIGSPGVGRRTLLKISCLLADKQLLQALPTDEKRIKDWYFSIIKSSFERRKQITVLVGLDTANNNKILSYLQKINNKYPIQELISNQNCQYAYSQINQYSEVSYDKFSKSFDEVISDFILISKQRINFLFYSTRVQVEQFIKNYHYLHQQTMYRFIEQVPSQSILQISNQILQKNLHEEADKKGLTNLFLKIYSDLIGLMKQNEINQKYHFKYNSFYHFKIINRFIFNYKKLLQKSKEKEDILNRSILKVHQISEILEKLKIQIKQIQPKAKQKTQKLLQVVPILQEKKKASHEVKVLVLNEKRQIQSRNAQIEQMMKEVGDKIAKAEPILQEANDSMLTLKRSQLSQLRNNANPHPLIKFTLQNMVILLGENESWQNIKKVLSDTNLLPRLKNISPERSNIKKARKRIQQNKQWTFDNVSKVSFGVRYMVRWINNIIKFYQLKNALQNQKQKVEQYKKELQRLEQKLIDKQKQLDIQEGQIKIIEDQYNFNKNQLISLQQLININNRKFENAQLIKNHLHQQINNWYDSLNQYKALKKNSQSTSIYITLFLEIFNTLHLEEQLKIEEKIKENFTKFAFNFDPNFDIFEYIKSSILRKKYAPMQRSKLKQQNRQIFVLQNLTIQDSSNPKIIQTLYHFQDRPILLDPDNQAINWIEKQLSGQGQNGVKVIITKQSFLSSVKSVQSALRQGHILILLIQDEMDQFTSDLLNSKVTEASGSKIIQYNKNILHIHNSFRLLMCNKSRNPNLSNKFYIDYPILNFQITKNILKNMLLQQLIVLQNKEIYDIRKQLQMQKKQNQKNISQIEQHIIESLINSKKTLIDDNEFINLLSQNQAKRMALKQNQAEWRQKNTNIKKIYDSYSDITQSMSKMFISLKLMSKTNPLLSWNSEIFVQYFVQSVILSISTPLFQEDDDEVPSARFLKQSNFEFDHYNISLSNSRPTSALSYVSGVTSQKVSHEQRKDDFQDQHPTSQHAFQNLIGYREMAVDEKQKGTMSVQREKGIKNKFIQFVKFAFTEEERIIWGLMLCFMDYPYKDIKNLIEIKAKRNKLKQYIEAGQLTDKIKNLASQNQKFQQQLQRTFSLSNPFLKLGQLTQLQVLLLCKLLFSSQFNNLCKILIKHKGFGQILNYSQIKTVNWFQRSDNVHPILLLMGEDPISRISQYLTKKKYKNVILIPMGEGQNKLAEAVLEKQSRKQNLVIIHNLQISQNFLVFLSKMLQQFQIKPPHKNFRLILISTMFQNLNEQITSYCHKYLIQQPMGIKNQMQYLQQINSITLHNPYHKKLEFVITYLHSIINNLSKYKPYGWNLKYQFHTTDFLNSIQTLKEVGESHQSIQNFQCNIDIEQQKVKLNKDEIDFKALKYMIGQIGYVGKLADDIDRAKMNIIINQFINPNAFNANNENEVGIKGIKFNKLNLQNINQFIDTINENDASIFGLHPSIKPISQYSHSILSKVAIVYSRNAYGPQDKKQMYLKPIEPINHKFQYINREINKYNFDLDKIKMEGATQALLQNMGNGLLLSNITPMSKIFNLKSFSNPRQFFIAIKKDIAHKNNVIYEKVELIWSFVPKQILAGVYGISNIKLQGGSVNQNHLNGYLDDGMEQKDLTLFVQAMVKKKQKDTRKLVNIPLYLHEERQGQINSYGDNTNLLVSVKIEATHPQEFWILRSTAFIVM